MPPFVTTVGLFVNASRCELGEILDAVPLDLLQFHGDETPADCVPSVQKTLEEALSKVADSPVTLLCAGRTDAGVHACGQVVHFDTQVVRSMKAWTMGANINLPHDISVSWAQQMPAHFHARFKAIARRYRYVICLLYTSPSPRDLSTSRMPSSA